MSSPAQERTRWGAVALVAVTALTLAGCGGGGTTAGGSSPSSNPATGVQKDAKLAAMVPSQLASAGKVRVATDPTYAPMEFFGPDNTTIVGVDPDLGAAIGQVLGVKFEFVKAGFDGIIPGLAAGKYDISMSSFSDTAEREKTVDFVTYGQAGTAMMVKKGNPAGLSPDGNSLCGRRVAVEKGTTQSDADIPARDTKCTAAGKAKIQALVFPDQNAANLALSSGRADAVLADGPVAEYAAAKSNGQFEVTGAAYAVDQYGIAIPKNQGQLKQAVLGAVQKLIADGTYQKILQKWSVQGIAITKPAINVATTP